MYSLPSTSRSTQPAPDSNATGNSFTWLLSPLKNLVQRACWSRDSGPGGGTGTCGTRRRSTRAHSRVEFAEETEELMAGKFSGAGDDDLHAETCEAP